MWARMLPPASTHEVSPASIRRCRYTAWWARWNEPSPRWSITFATIVSVFRSMGDGRAAARDASLRIEHVRGARIDVDADAVARMQRGARVLPRHQRQLGAGVHVDQRLRAQRLHQLDRALYMAR